MGAERQRPQQRCREAVVSRSGFRPEAPQGRACGSWVHSWPQPVHPGSGDNRPQRSQQGGLPSWSVGKGQRTPGLRPVPLPLLLSLSDTPCPPRGCSGLPARTEGHGAKVVGHCDTYSPPSPGCRVRARVRVGGERAFYGDREPRSPGQGLGGLGPPPETHSEAARPRRAGSPSQTESFPCPVGPDVRGCSQTLQ